MSLKKINGYIMHLKQPLGKGSYGQVYKGQHQLTKKPCAIKVLSKKLINSDQYLKSALLQQIQILQQVKSKNIVAVYEVMQSSNNYYIIQELCEGDLEKYIKTHHHISQERAIQILKQIVNGFISLVKQGIIHRDIKPANILISGGQMKIADFGFAKRNVPKKMKNQTAVGTPLYMSIQILKAIPYTSKCDVWSLGFIFYQILHRKTPWQANSIYDLVKCIQNKPLVIDHHLSNATKDFLNKTLAIYQRDRAQWDDVFKHDIFKGHFQQFCQNNKLIQNKLKVVMSKLRFKINSQNIDVKKMLKILGLDAEKIQLNFKQFHKFLQYIHPNLAQQEVRYFFDKVDEDNSGTISIQEIQHELSRHNITIQRSGKIKKALTLNQDAFNNIQLGTDLAERAKKCFQRLAKVLNYKKITLRKTFQAYNKQGDGQLTYQNFKNMIVRLDPSFNQEDIHSIFNFIDTDHSKTIDYQEFHQYFCKVNGVPDALFEQVPSLMIKKS